MSQASPFDRAHFKRALCEAPTHISIKRDAARACFGLHLGKCLMVRCSALFFDIALEGLMLHSGLKSEKSAI